MNGKEVTLAQFGCGYWGPNLVRNFSALPSCRVKYVVDSSSERRAFVSRWRGSMIRMHRLKVLRLIELCVVTEHVTVICQPSRHHKLVSDLSGKAPRPKAK